MHALLYFAHNFLNIHQISCRCGFKLHQTKDLSISTKTHSFGRGSAASAAPANFSYAMDSATDNIPEYSSDADEDYEEDD